MCPYPGYYLSGYSDEPNRFETLHDAWNECEDRDDCGGIVRERSSRYTLRKGRTLKPSKRNEISYRGCTNVTGDEVQKPQNKVEYHFKDRPAPKPGDIIEIEASYNKGVKLDIYEERSSGMVPGEFTIMVCGAASTAVEVTMEIGWKKYSPIPWGTPFKVQIYFLDDSYMVYVNKVYQGIHKYIAPLNSARFVMLHGAEEKFIWERMRWPESQKPSQIYSKRNYLRRPVKRLQKKIKKKISHKQIKQIKAYASSDVGSISILKEELLSELLEKKNYVDLRDRDIAWILRNREALEILLTSEGKYKQTIDHINYPKINIEAIQTLAEFVHDDPEIKTDATFLRWAVASSLTPRYVNSYGEAVLKIDNADMYYKKKKWLEEGNYFTTTKNMSSWHLKYTLSQRQFPSEVEWAHDVCPEENRTPLRVYKNTNLVKYRKENADGVPVHKDHEYYYYKPRTLPQIQKVGGVCGAISTFGEGMCRSWGVPAFTVGQPGHCAFVWYNAEADFWKGSYFVDGWDETYIKDSWYADRGERMLAAEYLPIMNELQGKRNKEYRLSEKLRLAHKFAESDEAVLKIFNEAVLTEPRNVYAWANLKDTACKIPESARRRFTQDVIWQNLQRIVKSKEAQTTQDVALNKPISTDDWYKPHRINDGDDDGAKCAKSKSSFKIDLEGVFSKFSEIKFQWWHRCWPDTIKIYARDSKGRYSLVLTEDDVVDKDSGPDGDGKDSWWILRGWEKETTKIRVDLYGKNIKDRLYNKYYVGIRKFKPYAAIGYKNIEEISTRSASVNKKQEIELSLGGMATIQRVDLDWGSKRAPSSLTFLTRCGRDEYKEVKARRSEDNVYMLDQEAASDLKIALTGYSGSKVRVTVTGTKFSEQEIMELAVDLMIPNPSGILTFAKEAIKEEFAEKICYK